jgi:hypothetical protein
MTSETEIIDIEVPSRFYPDKFIKVSYTRELINDLKSIGGIDAEAYASNVLKDEIFAQDLHYLLDEFITASQSTHVVDLIYEKYGFMVQEKI